MPNAKKVFAGWRSFVKINYRDTTYFPENVLKCHIASSKITKGKQLLMEEKVLRILKVTEESIMSLTYYHISVNSIN